MAAGRQVGSNPLWCDRIMRTAAVAKLINRSTRDVTDLAKRGSLIGAIQRRLISLVNPYRLFDHQTGQQGCL
jgi:hypothetical protein